MKTICAILVLSALAGSYNLVNAAPLRRAAVCTFLSFRTLQKLELLEDGSVTALGQDRGVTTEFDLTTLPELYHVLIMKQDSETFLVYNNGNFSHGTPKNNNHVFLVEHALGGLAITLKAVNHQYNTSNETELGSSMEEEEEEGERVDQEEEEEEEEGAIEEAEMMMMEKDCYLGFTEEGKPMCYPSKLSEDGEQLYEILFFTPCYN